MRTLPLRPTAQRDHFTVAIIHSDQFVPTTRQRVHYSMQLISGTCKCLVLCRAWLWHARWVAWRLCLVRKYKDSVSLRCTSLQNKMVCMALLAHKTLSTNQWCAVLSQVHTTWGARVGVCVLACICRKVKIWCKNKSCWKILKGYKKVRLPCPWQLWIQLATPLYGTKPPAAPHTFPATVALSSRPMAKHWGGEEVAGEPGT